MKPEKLFCVLIAAALPILAGCFSSTEDEIYTVFKCGKVATLLGRDADADTALRKGRAQLGKVQGGAFDAMRLGQRFQEDVPLYQYPPSSQFAMLLELYGSKACQSLYR
jgi:hypothetical protein